MGFDPRRGARNLLLSCAQVAAGQTVVVVAEDPSLGFYDDLAVRCITEVAEELGCRSRRLSCGLVCGPDELPDAIAEALRTADHVIFQARAGDAVRFTALPGRATKTMSYALDIGLLGSEFCTVPHGLMKEILRLLERAIDDSGTWRISCPLGTDVSGAVVSPDPAAGHAPTAGAAVNDFSLRLFPVPIFRPVLCAAASGRVAVAHWLMSTANHAYDQDLLPLPEPVTAVVQGGRVAGFEGEPALVESVRRHYDRVAGLFGIDADVVHSWHAGIHPQAFYPLAARSDTNRWGSVAFANPRYAHFHTCGDYAPGEIAWSLFDATIELDGRAYWRRGRFVCLDQPEIRRLAEEHGVSPRVLAQRKDIGLPGEAYA